MRGIEDVKKLKNALVDFCLTNGRHHDQKTAMEQQADDLAAILSMKLEMLQTQMESGQEGPTAETGRSETDRLATLLADLSVMASAGTLHQVLGQNGAGELLETLGTVQSAGDAELAAGLEHIDRGNYLRDRGESRARMALLAEKRDLVDGKLRGGRR